MSEWVKRSGWWRREYAPDFVGEAAVGGHGQVHPWQCADYSLASRPVNGAEGYAPTLAEAQARCDEAALAYLVVALARKAAAWAEGIDAELARRYRAAHLAMDAWEFDDARRTTATEQEVDALFAAVTATHAALVRGYL